MNPSSSILASVVVIVTTSIFRRVREGKWQGSIVEVIVFGFMLLIALQLLALVMPGLAKVLGYLGIVGAFVVNGPAIFGYAKGFDNNPEKVGRSATNIRRVGRSGG